MKEEWRDITGYEGLYQVSNLGRFKSLNYNRTGKERIMKPSRSKNGYYRVILCKNGKIKNNLAHRIVAQAFIPNPDNLPEVNHKNEIKTDNRVENLEWCNHKYNMNYGTGRQRFSMKHKNGKTSKKVFQYTLTGEFVAEYPSANEAYRQLGFFPGGISSCCLGKCKTAYGYVWRYLYS